MSRPLVIVVIGTAVIEVVLIRRRRLKKVQRVRIYSTKRPDDVANRKDKIRYNIYD